MRWSASNTNPWFALPRGWGWVSSLQRAPTQPFCFLLQFFSFRFDDSLQRQCRSLARAAPAARDPAAATGERRARGACTSDPARDVAASGGRQSVRACARARVLRGGRGACGGALVADVRCQRGGGHAPGGKAAGTEPRACRSHACSHCAHPASRRAPCGAGRRGGHAGSVVRVVPAPPWQERRVLASPRRALSL